jgi:hypothetical protein
MIHSFFVNTDFNAFSFTFIRAEKRKALLPVNFFNLIPLRDLMLVTNSQPHSTSSQLIPPPPLLSVGKKGENAFSDTDK